LADDRTSTARCHRLAIFMFIEPVATNNRIAHSCLEFPLFFWATLPHLGAETANIGSIANPEQWREDSRCFASRSCGEQIKLLSEWWSPIAGILRLLFVHHVNHLGITERSK
jgi:hypothetical protein